MNAGTGQIRGVRLQADRRRWLDARGQSTAFVASMLFVMVIFVSVVANVGQAVNRRVALQTIADAGAYTGASVMAVGYNQLAYWNTMMQWAWFAFTQPPVAGPMWQAFVIHAIPSANSCGTADMWENAYRGVMTGLQGIYNTENILYTALATSEATRVSRYNGADLFPSDYLNIRYREWDPLEGINRGHWIRIAPSREVPDGTQPKAIGWLGSITINSRQRNSYLCFRSGPFGIQIPVWRSNRRYQVWYRKDPGAQSFVWVVTAPRSKAFMFDRWFGGDIIPEMKAVAVAKPIGGNIEEGKDIYRTKFMPVATVMIGNQLLGNLLPGFLQSWITGQAGLVRDPGYDRRVRIVTH
jgi:hypothetical protein